MGSYATCQIIQVPTPAPSKSNGGDCGKAKILLASSVMIQPVLVPIALFEKITLSGSGFPSTQIEASRLPSEKLISPPSTEHMFTIPMFSPQMVGVVTAVQSLGLSPAPLYSRDCPASKAGTKSPVDQIPAATATEDRP